MNDEKDNVKSDYDYSRETYYDLIEKGREGLEDMIHVARESEHPRAYEVASTLIKTMVEANKELLDVHKQKKDLEKEEYQGPTKAVQNNTVFVGSTKELQQQLLQLAKGARTTDE